MQQSPAAIEADWDDIVRIVASIKEGAVAPSAILRKLAAYKRQNRLDFALAELGRIERTLFALDWLEQPDLRRACQAGLNKGEARHTLAAAIYTNRQGRFTDRSIENQEYRASGLNLLIAAISYWAQSAPSCDFGQVGERFGNVAFGIDDGNHRRGQFAPS